MYTKQHENTNFHEKFNKFNKLYANTMLTITQKEAFKYK